MNYFTNKIKERQDRIKKGNKDRLKSLHNYSNFKTNHTYNARNEKIKSNYFSNTAKDPSRVRKTSGQSSRKAFSPNPRDNVLSIDGGSIFGA